MTTTKATYVVTYAMMGDDFEYHDGASAIVVAHRIWAQWLDTPWPSVSVHATDDSSATVHSADGDLIATVSLKR